MVAEPTADELYRVLDHEGALVPGSEIPEIPDEDLQRILVTMLLVRRLDERMTQLQRQGRIGFYVPCTGEEASHFAVLPLRQDDWVFPSWRDQGAWLWRGHGVASYVHQLFGSAADPARGRQIPTHHSSRAIQMVSVSAPPGTHIPQAVGVAQAARIQRTDQVAMALFGEGAVATGDFHVGMNFAGVYRAPVVLVCRNRGPAPSAAEGQRAAAARLAARGRGYGVHTVRVDGNDVLAVIHVASAAVARARAGEGPTLIEARIETAGSADPVLRLRAHLQRRGLWSAEREAEILQQHEQAIVEALRQAEQAGPPVVDTLFDDVYESPPWHLDEQRRYLLAQDRIPARNNQR
ncbi:MAG TPA: thiamine pyrophosphate-dependent enzyme [Haliangium sp.]|nr:thiamine pyrophosphate-dependent enzyme [Haliangium sp.]